jgi:hypothetical protein
VHAEIEAQRREAAEVEVEDVERRGLDGHLELIVVLQAERVVAVAAVGGATRGLHVRGAPRFGAERAQKRRAVEGAGAHFHVVGLQDHAALLGPESLQREDQALERAFRGKFGRIGHGAPRCESGATLGTAIGEIKDWS